VVNAILKKHKIEAMKTYASSVRGAHNIINGGYRWQGDYFLDFYKVPQDVIEKVGAEMKKAGVKGVEVKKGIIGGDFTKTGLSEATLTEKKYYVTYNKGRGQGKDLEKEFDQKTFKTTNKPKVFNSYNDAKKYAEKMEKMFRNSIGGGTAYWVSDEKMNPIKEAVNELTHNEKSIRDGNPNNVYYAFYKGQFEAIYSAMGPSGLFDMYWDKFKVRRPAGSKFKLNPEFVLISKKDYDSSTSNRYAKLKPHVDKFWDKLQNESITETKSDYEVYHKSYTSAIQAAKAYAEKKGYEINDDDSFRQIGMGPRKPSEGKTNKFSIELSKGGKVQRKKLQIQVYGMRNSYELNAYIQ
jgi:hypothetical protein